MTNLRVWRKYGRLLLIALVGSFFATCSGKDWDERLVGDWVEDKEADEMFGPTSFSIFSDHTVWYDTYGECGTGWPKQGLVEVDGNSLSFDLDLWEDVESSEFEFHGDSLVLFQGDQRASYYRGELTTF